MKKLMFMGILLAIAGSMHAGDNLKIADFEIEGGEEKAIEIELNNADNEITGVQCDLILPEGLSLATFLNDDEEEVLGELTSRKRGDLSLTVQKVEEGKYRFLVFSMSNKTFKGTSGGIIKIVAKASSTISSGSLTGKITAIVLTPPSGDGFSPDDVTFNITATTAINQIELSNDKPATIYDLKGNVVRKNATTTNGLRSGVYIINNKKVLVK